MITKEQVLEKLKTIIDPELNVNIMELGLVYGVEIDPSAGSGQAKVIITMTLTTPACPLSLVFDEWVKNTVKKIKGVKDVKINLVWEPVWEPGEMADSAKEQLGIIN